ncbi:MAG: SCO2522 family protein [Pseudonocardiaceae bacterium]
MDADTYSEATARENIRALPLSHLSIEVGHFYMEDLLSDQERIRTQFQRVRPWIATSIAAVEAGSNKPRVSTCFLIDDYFRNDTDPGEILDKLIKIADDCGVQIDYVAREAGCCVADDVPLAELTAAKLRPEPSPGSNGSRPPTYESGWLCNGERSREPVEQAMRARPWQPPQEFGKRQHSIFVDLELWKDATTRVSDESLRQRTWSCPFLASVWQLLRLGMLRHYGEAVALPHTWPLGTDWPDHWDQLPPVIRLNPHASPFAAYRTISILPQFYLPIENAVRVILGHLSVDDNIVDQIVDRAAKEGVRVSRSVIDRISQIFVEGS